MLPRSLALLSLCSSSLALAGDPAALLAACDEAMTRAEDQTISWKITNQEPGKADPKNMAFTVQLKGAKTLTSFTEPADLNGTRVLVQSRAQMYIWLPQYNRMRRIASHVTQQGFMGTTYSYEDMGGFSYSDVYDAALTSEAEGTAVLTLTPKTDAEAPYAKVELTIDTESKLPQVIKNYNDKGVHVKTETRTEYGCQGDVCVAGLMKMEEHTREAWTELRRVGWEVNSGLSDDTFSVRNLQRGE
jgi:outer membrane lipoprotein-sorting protein